MNRISKSWRIGLAVGALTLVVGFFAHKTLPRWFPVAYYGAWGAIGMPDNRNVPASLRDLPVVLMDGQNEGGPIAVMLSGNAGWWGIDDGITSGLARAGVTTIGLNSLAYFIQRRSPDEVVVTIERMVAPFRADRPIILVGYSFGADVAATIYARLPPSLRERIHLVSLLGLSHRADYAIGFMRIVDKSEQTIPAIAAIAGPHIQCFAGVDERISACGDLDPRHVEVIKVPGGHHFDGNYDDLARRILAGLPEPRSGDPMRYARTDKVALLAQCDAGVCRGWNE